MKRKAIAVGASAGASGPSVARSDDDVGCPKRRRRKHGQQQTGRRRQDRRPVAPLDPSVPALSDRATVGECGARTKCAERTRSRGDKAAKNEKGLLDIPDEVLLCVAYWAATGRDVEALGAACARLHCVARDDHLWRMRFERLFASQYEGGTAALPWHEGAHPDDPWPAFAEAFWRTALYAHEPTFCLASPHMLAPDGADRVRFGLAPRCAHDSRVPAPFAHMVAAHRDWRWFCAVHESPLRPYDTPTARASGPGRMTLARRRCSLKSGKGVVRIEHRGDISSAGLADGYGVEIHFDAQGNVVTWIEAMWRDDQVVGWRTIVDRQGLFSALSDCPAEGARLGYAVDRTSGDRMWGPATQCAMDGACVWVDPAGTQYSGVLYDNRRLRATALFADDSVGAFHYDSKGRRHGEAAIRYPNGDVLAFEYERDAIKAVTAFHTSLRCPVRALAGRSIMRVPGWRWCVVAISDRSRDYAFWPVSPSFSTSAPLVGDSVVGNGNGAGHVPDLADDADDVTVFWQYVSRGLAGWNAHVQQTVMANAPCSFGPSISPMSPTDTPAPLSQPAADNGPSLGQECILENKNDDRMA